MAYETILTSKEGMLGIITLNRPQAMNALSLKLVNELISALDEFEKDSLLRQTLGEPMFEEYLKQKSFEVAQAADQVTQWEIDHFLDLG
jgi:glutamine synthetase